jgi:hypothetical protein
MLRGIQILGLLIALSALMFVLTARRRKRLNSRSFLFWMLFWGIFIILDLYPSLASYLAPALTLESNMFVLTAGSVLTLFVFVFVLYSFLSDLNQKVTKLVREQAILHRKVVKMLEVLNNEKKEDRDSNSSS